MLRLVKCGAGIDAKCKSQYTALHYAIKGTHLAVFDALIENGCKVRTSAAKHNIVALVSPPWYFGRHDAALPVIGTPFPPTSS